MTDNKNSGDIIAGRNPVIEALKSGKLIDTVYISGDGGSLNLIRRLAKEKSGCRCGGCLQRIYFS